MCGICGGNDLHRNYESGINAISHRGPDGMRLETYPLGISMGFCRLAIIDLSEKAMQPMSSKDGRIHLVFNGEIYGYRDIINRYIKNTSYNLMTSSDTEVILALYEIYGEKFIGYIDGMFSIVIYDERKQKLLLYRDRVGIKPLYYYLSGDSLLFASELKSIKAMLKNNEIVIDNSAVYDFFSYGYIPEPKTLYKNVYKLEPAHCLRYDICRNKVERIYSYWELNVNDKKIGRRNLQEIEEQYRFLVQKSVREQLVSDVPVCVFFSGGVDSGILAYETKKVNAEVETYSIGFADKRYSEEKFIVEFAKEVGIKNNIDILEDEIIGDVYYKSYRDWFDEPFDDLTAIPTYLLSSVAAKNVKVALSGDGNDELFGGYCSHQAYYLWVKGGIRNRLDFCFRHPKCENFNGKYLDAGMMYYAELYGCIPDCYRKIKKRRMGLSEDYDEYWFYRKHWRTDLPPYTRVRYADFMTYLPGDILTKTDRSSMAVSLEVRVPFLSRDLVEFSFSLAEEECNRHGEMKGIVKGSYSTLLSDTLLHRKKHGFTVPHESIKATRNSGKNKRWCLYDDLWG